MICLNPDCNKKIPKERRKYCSSKCQQKSIYERKKETYKKQSREWKKNNPEKHREQMLKSSKKFRTEKRERFNELMRNQYYKHKPKWQSRDYTSKIIKFKRKINVNKVCNKCKSKKNLSLKFEVYPRKAEDIRQAIKDKKIYYLCRECRYRIKFIGG